MATKVKKSSRVKSVKPIKDEPDLSKFITEAKGMKDYDSKMDAAKELFTKMKGMKRKYVIEVFMKGIGLTKAGSGTYYQLLKTKK